MDHLVSRCTLAALFSLTAACGVSAERVNALEAQIKQMQSAVTETGESDPKLASFDQRLSGLEATTKESVGNLEKIFEVLQAEVAKVSQTAKNSNGGQDATTADAWADADSVLGIETQGVIADGDTFTIDHAWLVRQVDAMAASGKNPKFAAGKKGGVTIRGFKPQSFFDQLGLKNGDTIAAVNDVAVASVAELSVALRQGKNPTVVKLQRKKKEVTLTYKVTD